VGDADLVAAAHPDDEVREPADARPSKPAGGSIAPAPPVPPHVAEQVTLLRRAAQIHLSSRSAPSDAVPLLERVTGLVPHDREALMLLVDAYTSANREREAAQVLERVIASFGNRRTKELSVFHHRLGRTLATLGDKDVALAQFDMAFKIDPGSVEVLRDLGVLALETNDLDRAQKTFRALLLQRLDAQSGISKGEVFYYLGEISMKQGDRAKAVQMLERAVENEPTLDRAKSMLSQLKA
jgi:tetratricopeptide (TPR) repeat protein